MRADFEAILREASTASDLDEVLAIIVRRVKGALPVDVCAVCLTDAASDRLVRVSSSGADVALPIPAHLASLLRWSSNAESWSFSQTRRPAHPTTPLLLNPTPATTPFSACR